MTPADRIDAALAMCDKATQTVEAIHDAVADGNDHRHLLSAAATPTPCCATSGRPTMTDAELLALCDAVAPEGGWFDCDELVTGTAPMPDLADARYIAAVSPDVVRALVLRAQRAEARVAGIVGELRRADHSSTRYVADLIEAGRL